MYHDAHDYLYEKDNSISLKIKGKSAHLAMKAFKQRENRSISQLHNDRIGALTKIIISKRGRPYKISNN